MEYGGRRQSINLRNVASALIVLASCSAVALSVSAQDNSSTQPSTDSSQPAGAPAKPLQGGVQKVELNLEKLRDVGLDLKHVLKAADSLYDEVTIQPVRITTEPEVVGPGIIVNIPIGTEPIGPPQPARKERVDFAMAQIKPVVDMMKKNVDDFMDGNRQLELPDSVQQELKPQFTQWVDKVNTLASHATQLEQITQAPPYDNQAIAAVAVEMQKDIKSLDKTRLAIYKVVRKEGKRIAAYVATQQ